MDKPETPIDDKEVSTEELHNLQASWTAGYLFFSYVDKALKGQMDLRVGQVMTTPCSMDKIPEQEFVKGESAGIDLARKMFSTLAEGIAQELASRKETGENHD